MLQQVYSDSLFSVNVDGVEYPLSSLALNNRNDIAILTEASRVFLSMVEDVFTTNCNDVVNNSLHIMLLRNTMVSYGDEGREKQEHIVDYSVYANSLVEMSENEPGILRFDLTPFLMAHKGRFLENVRNNLYFTTRALREYHYQKQKKMPSTIYRQLIYRFRFLSFTGREIQRR